MGAHSLTTRFKIGRRAFGFWLAGAALLLLFALTGRSTSPFLPLAVPWLGSAATRFNRPARVLGPAFFLILFVSLIDGRGAVAWLIALAIALASALVYLRLQDAPTRAARKRAADAPSTSGPPLLEQAVDGVRSGWRAGRAILWQTSTERDRAEPWVVRGGLFRDAVPMRGDVLGWSAQHSLSLRAETLPGWVETSAQACAVAPVGNGVLLSLEFDRLIDLPTVDDLNRAGAYLAAFVEVERERSASSEDRRRINALMAILKQLPTEIEPQPMAQRLADAALHLSAADGVAVATWDGEDGRIVALAGEPGNLQVNATFNAGESETALAAHAGGTVTRAQRGRDSLPIITSDEVFAVRPRALAALPLANGGRVVGTLTLWTAEPQLDAAGLDTVEALAPYAGMQFSNAQAFGQMRERADRDRLTGLLNRQAFDAQLAAENARFHRYLRPFSLLLLDIDHFKNVNDRYGHQAGDAVLTCVAKVLSNTLREVDLAARYGGEEFAVLLPETELAAAVEIAERVRRKLAVTETETMSGRVIVTASIGVAACPECARDPDTLIRNADRALYRSKDEGRNRVTGAPRLIPR